MSRTIGVLVLGVIAPLLLAGCSAAVPVAAPQTAALTTSESANTYLTAHEIYAERLYRVTEGPPFDGDSQVALYIGGAEPTGTEPFRMLAVLSHENPGQRAYSVNYSVRAPGSEHSGALILANFMWEPKKGTVAYYAGTGTLRESTSGAALVGTASGVEATTLAGIAAGTQPIPAFE